MANNNRPTGREKHVTGQGRDIKKRGEGLGTGPVGSADGHAGRKEAVSGQSAQQSTSHRAVTRGLGGGGLLIIVILGFLLLNGNGGLSGILGSLMGDGSTASYTTQQQTSTPQYNYTQSSSTQSSQSSTNSTTQPSSSSSASSPFGGLDLSSLLGGTTTPASLGNVSTGWTAGSNTRKLDTTVAAGSRAKYTQILGGGRDVNTIMVYMCGTDLESRSSMGTYDLQEMLNATVNDSINLIVFTGGCKAWKNNVVSSSVNQIYQIKNGQMTCLEQNAGTAAMTDPNNLASFIQYCAQRFPANRYDLILWDHGGGSLSGYGYDEKNSRSGSMSLKGIDQALTAGGVQFDFIGFDACLMATLENALMLTEHGDYLIASEETEPGVGWYYTDWLTKLSANPSMSTLEIGKNICDDFVTVCNQKCRGQATTLSVVDLAELENTTPAAFKSFASGTAQMLQNGQYQAVSNARSSAREFAASNRLDQIDVIHLAQNLNTTEGKALAAALLGAVKYNNTSSSMTNAYGLSIYFPYRSASKVDSAVAQYNAIGLDSEYARVIQQFASYETAGQSVTGGSSSALEALLGSYGGSSSSAYSGSEEMIAQLLGSLLGGRSLANIDGLDDSNSAFLQEGLTDVDSVASYLSENHLDSSQLVWAGDPASIRLSEQQWSLVNELELNVFFDDGEGYIDLGLDNVFTFTEDGALLGEYDGTWLAIDDMAVPYYYSGSTYNDDGTYTITGTVPVLLNGERARLLLVFDDENPYGYIAGALTDYHDGETETVAKAMTELTPGDEIDIVCDYYTYDGDYQDSYLLYDTFQYTGNEEISNVYIDAEAAQPVYRFTDIYGQHYWTPAF